MVARYVTLEPSYGSIVPGGMHVQIPAGTEIDYEGEPGFHMQPINAEAQQAVEAKEKRRKMPHQRIDPIMAVIKNGQDQSKLEALREQEGNNVLVEMSRSLKSQDDRLAALQARLDAASAGDEQSSDDGGQAGDPAAKGKRVKAPAVNAAATTELDAPKSDTAVD